MEKNKKKVLIVLTRIPFPPVDGTRKRIMDIIQGSYPDFSLDLLVVGDEKIKPEVKLSLEEFFNNIYIRSYNKISLYFHSIKSLFSGRPLQAEYYFNKQVADFIKKQFDNYDVVYFHTIRLGRYIEILNKENCKKIFLDLNDAISLNYQDAKRLARFPWNLIYYFEEGRVRNYETRLLSNVLHANVVSEFDEKYLKDNCKYNNLNIPKFYSIFPGVELHNKVEFKNIDKPKIVFFGNIKYPPNKDAVLYFVSEIFPELRARINNITFVIAGNGSENIRLPYSEGIEKIGFVKDLKDLFLNVSLVVAPIRFGAGVPTKILEALSYGVPVLTSPIGVRGMVIKDDNSGIKCINLEDKLGWINFIEDVVSNINKRELMAESAQIFIKENYLQEITKEKYCKAFHLISCK